MAKKTVATLQTGGGKEHTKCIQFVKNEQTGGYSFRQETIHNNHVKAWFSKK